MTMTDEQHDAQWRISKSGHSIKEGWHHFGNGRIVAKYAGPAPNTDGYVAFRKWMDDAEEICDAHNRAAMAAP